MTRSSPSFIQQDKPPDPPLTSSSLSKSSLNSSSSSLSPSASVLMSTRPSLINTTRTSYRSSKSPVLPSTGSLSSSTRNTKLEQIIQNFYTKTVQVIVQSRVPADCLKGKSKSNKWFNISTEDNEQIREETRYWKSFIKQQQEGEVLSPPPPPLLLEIFSMDKKVILETWTLTLNKWNSHPLHDFPVDLPNLYKRSIVFFRSLHSLVRLLPAYSLRNKRKSESSLGYRLSTKLSHHSDEISIGQVISDSDRIQAYELTDVATPLGTLKLKLLYREHCQFDKLEEKASLTDIDIEEDFFRPLMKYQEQRKESIRPISLPAIMKTHEAVTDKPHRGSMQWIKPSTSTERRLSTAFVSPFKSPSLSSSPQAELMFSSRSQTSDKMKLESGSFGRKREFSSSFEKYKSNSPNRISTGDTSGISMMRRLSRTSDHSSIYLESEVDDDLGEFMRFIGSKQELKLFQNNEYNSAMITESHSSLFGNDSIYKSKKALSHFRTLQETHNTLSDTMLLNQQNPTSDYYSNVSQHSYGSSSSSNKGLNQPAIPSPLHTTESIASLSHNQSPKDLIPTPPPLLTSFFDYDKDTKHSKSHHHRHHQDFIEKKELAPIVLQNRQPAPSPPPTLQQRYSGGQSLGDDDDSLVFKMSELGYEGSSQLEFNTTATEYTKRLQQRGMRRINSSGNVPRLKKRSPGSDEEEEQKKSPNSSSSSAISSKSDPVSMPPAGTLAHSLFYDS